MGVLRRHLVDIQYYLSCLWGLFHGISEVRRTQRETDGIVGHLTPICPRFIYQFNVSISGLGEENIFDENPYLFECLHTKLPFLPYPLPLWTNCFGFGPSRPWLLVSLAWNQNTYHDTTYSVIYYRSGLEVYQILDKFFCPRLYMNPLFNLLVNTVCILRFSFYVLLKVQLVNL